MIRSMESVELRRNISRQLPSGPSKEVDETSSVPEVMKFGLQDSLVSKFIHKPVSFENLKLDLGEPMLNHVINQVRLEMIMQKG